MRTRSASAEVDARTADVLIVDDDAESREGLLESIQQLGYVTIAAADGVEALRLSRERSPRLILLDLEMPVMNGWQFLERRRVDPPLASIPVVVLTVPRAVGSPPSDVQGRLQKPVDERALLAVLQAFMPAPTGAGQPETESDATAATILLVEDDHDTQASIAELLEEDGYRVLRASDGGEAEALLERRRPDCIVIDLWMPVMDGWTFVERLGQREGSAIPTVVVTAAGPHWGYPVPLARVMRKPLDARAFLDLIHRTLATAAGSRSSSRA